MLCHILNTHRQYDSGREALTPQQPLAPKLEHPYTDFICVILKADIVYHACPEQTFEDSKEGTADEQTSQIEGYIL
jgi:hypothetical protein